MEDAQLAAHVVRNIREIESQYFRACGVLSDRLMTEVAEAMRGAVPKPWQVRDDDGISLICPDWQSASGLRSGDAWLAIEEVTGDYNEHSWVAAATGSGLTSMCFELQVRRGLTSVQTGLAANPDLVATLIDRGFEQSDEGKRLILPIKLDADELAQAFESQDFDEALAPVRYAVGLALAAKADLDTLIEVLRKHMKRR